MTVFRFLISPVGGLALLVVLFTINSLIAASAGEYPSDAAELAWGFGFTLGITWWTYSDRRRRSYDVPYEFEFFVFIAWPLILPYYFFKTRGWRAILNCVAVAAAFFTPELISWTAYEIFWAES